MTEPSAIEADALDPALVRPGSAREIFWVFNRMAMQGFGGTLAVAQRELVDRTRWMSREAFLESLSVSQVLPGPNIINLALQFGDAQFGVRGALAACLGLLIAPLIIVLTLATLYARFSHYAVVAGALRGMSAVAAGLVVATAVKLGASLNKNPLGIPVCLALAALMFGGMALEHWPLWWMLAVLGPLSMALVWRKLARR